MKILVLGGGGFIGTSLGKQLLAESHSVCVLDRNLQGKTTVQPHEKLD